MLGRTILLFILTLTPPLLAEQKGDLFRDLMVVKTVNEKINDRVPVSYNHLLQGGYVVMPSARVPPEGRIAFGYAKLPPYRIYSLSVQMVDRLEVVGNYRIFKGIEDPILSPFGFGDFSDKGASVKFVVVHPEDSDYRLPGIAVGVDDFMGTKAFNGRYLVLTQVFPKLHLECSLGYGEDRYGGFFGGFAYSPWRHSKYQLLHGITFVAEYDSTEYKDPEFEPHPRGRQVDSRLNTGVRLRLSQGIEASATSLRGETFAFSVSGSYSFNRPGGIAPKIDDPLPYSAPINTEQLGVTRTEKVMVQDFAFALEEQGFALLKAKLFYGEPKTLKLWITNPTYRSQVDVRRQLRPLISLLTPSDIDDIVIVFEADGLVTHQIRFPSIATHRYRAREIGEFEFDVLSPMKDVDYHLYDDGLTLYKEERERWNLFVLPRIRTFFGSSKGKFKYSVGLNGGIEGYLPGGVFYQMMLGYSLFEDIEDCTDRDMLNPSQIINVRSDQIRYFKTGKVTFDRIFLQKSWNLGHGWYYRLGAGHFEELYGGLSQEVLYYPTSSSLAVGFEYAFLRKREVTGLGFDNTIRRLVMWDPIYEKYRGRQYFLDLYYSWHEAALDAKISVGRFLARDFGARYEVSRTFASGLRISLWYTHTDKKDIINGERYHDKGVAFSVPLDMALLFSSRQRWGYGMSAWLRDVGARAETGFRLYDTLSEERR